MSLSTRAPLPLGPLLHTYSRAGLPSISELHRLSDLGPRFGAVLGATARFLCDEYLDRASDAQLADSLVRFYECVVRAPLYSEVLRSRAGFVRHGLGYLLRGSDSLPAKMNACLSPLGAYHVAGLGPQFWSALVQPLRPAANPAWTPEVLAGLERLGLYCPRPGESPAEVYAALMAAYARIQSAEPALSALHVDHFLTLVARMHGRHLFGAEVDLPRCPVATAIERVRRRQPLRDLLKQRGPAFAAAQEEMESALVAANGKGIGNALAVADPAGAGYSPLDWGVHAERLSLWVRQLWETEDPNPLLAEFWRDEPLPGGGLWLPPAVLHLRDPQKWQPWSEEIRRGYATLDDTSSQREPAEAYRLFTQGVAWLQKHHGLHPLETPDVLAALAGGETAPQGKEVDTTFGGFCADSFLFLAELGHNNRREWMVRQRGRYRFAVREPLAELCRALAERYVQPVLRGVHGWEFDIVARSGRALTSICKNGFGKTQPYNTTLWIAFSQRSGCGARAGAQFFVRLDAGGLLFGLRLGRKSRDAVRRCRKNLHEHAEVLFRALQERGACAACEFACEEDPQTHLKINGPSDVRAWAAGKSFIVSRSLAPDAEVLQGNELVGEVLLTFDRLVSLYACAVEEDARSFLAQCINGGAEYGEAEFQQNTFLGSDWLRRARDLLELKKQLILQGVPGTGKTHVARCLAKLLTAGRQGAVRLVQFHPAYSYEEFVEGIKVRSVAVDGRHDVTYPVEDGVLCAFAAEASRRPSDTFVLVIDEINRGNLPRVFGELLYLLEYREQAIDLPYSRRSFRLPRNLYVLATMNVADRSVALVDQALRRRFSFLDMRPDAGVLASWLATHVPAGPAFGERLLGLFERLNARLRADLGPHGQVGHSYFMVENLDEAKLQVVWQHHIRPLLEEHFAARPDRLASYELNDFLEGKSSSKRRRRAEPVSN
jgi:uncharacterized protein (DUF2461 family)